MGHAQNGEDEQRDQQAIAEHGAINQWPGLRHQGDRTGPEGGGLLARHQALQHKGEHSRHQQHHRHHRAHGEILLADHLLVDVGGQHVVAAANHLGGAKVSEHIHKHHDRSAYQAIAHRRQRDAEEGAWATGAQHGGRLVNAGVSQGQCRDHDQHGMGKGPQRAGHDDADGPIDGLAHQHALEQALVPEPVHQADSLEQRGAEQRHQRHDAEKTAPAHLGAGQGVGVGKSQHHHNHSSDAGDQQAVAHGLPRCAGAEVAAVIGQADKDAVAVLQAAHQDHAHRQQQGQQHEGAAAQQQPAHQAVVAVAQHGGWAQVRRYRHAPTPAANRWMAPGSICRASV